MPFVFYDTETTGKDTAFDQILQFAAIYTNYDLEIEDEERDVINVRCKRLPHIVPSPGALNVTRVNPADLDTANLSHYDMTRDHVYNSVKHLIYLVFVPTLHVLAMV